MSLALFLLEEMECSNTSCLQCVRVYLDLGVVEMNMLSDLFIGYGGYDDYNGYNDGYGFGSDRFGRGKISLIGIVTKLSIHSKRN